MKLTEIAAQLNNIEYPCRIDDSIIEQAKANNIVIVFGASDDLIEFRGAINDENGIGEEDVTLIDNEGVLHIGANGYFTDLKYQPDSISECRKAIDRFDNSVPVASVWCPNNKQSGLWLPNDGSGPSWVYSVPEHIEWEPFNVMEDGSLYCVGIVFKLP